VRRRQVRGRTWAAVTRVWASSFGPPLPGPTETAGEAVFMAWKVCPHLDGRLPLEMYSSLTPRPRRVRPPDSAGTVAPRPAPARWGWVGVARARPLRRTHFAADCPRSFCPVALAPIRSAWRSEATCWRWIPSAGRSERWVWLRSTRWSRHGCSRATARKYAGRAFRAAPLAYWKLMIRAWLGIRPFLWARWREALGRPGGRSARPRYRL